MVTTNKKHPDILYHYCPLDTFVKIIKSKTLRFGDITKSNDSEELFYIYKLYHMYRNDGKTDGFNPNLFFAKQDNENNKTYCFCLSELKDDLSQWRGYAPNGGVAIGFDYKKLKEFSESITSNAERHISLTKIIK